jgi:hypothetical protein
MSRAVGQVRVQAALAGGAVALLLLIAVVATLDWLVPPGSLTPVEDAPAQDDAVPGAVRCPASLPPEPLTVASSALFDCPRLYDGALIRYRGEAIAAVLPRGERAWVQLNDDVYALESGPIAEHRTALGGNAGIAVSLPSDVAASITFVGGAAARGDILDVVGRYRRADPADGGGPTIQAEQARIVEVGRRIDRPVAARRVVVAGVLTLAVCVLLLLVRRQRRA